MGNTVRMRIPGIYCGSIFAGTMGTLNLAINRPTQIFRHLRYVCILVWIHVRICMCTSAHNCACVADGGDAMADF